MNVSGILKNVQAKMDRVQAFAASAVFVHLKVLKNVQAKMERVQAFAASAVFVHLKVNCIV